MGNLLIEKRREMGSRLKDVADLIGAGITTLYNWEHGGVQTVSLDSMGHVRNLALLYDVDPQEIVQAIENNYILAHSGHDVGRYRANSSSIKGSGDDDNSSDEESIVEITQEVCDNVIKEDDTSFLNKTINIPNVIDNTITCGEAIDKALDAVFMWGNNRRLYDDMLDTMRTQAPKDVNHRTIKESQIETYILSLLYGNVSFDDFCTIKDSLKNCLDMEKRYNEEDYEDD